ncbi:MAG: phage tail protein [Oscillospiraceae bacterium]|nr:phage tail protein [Oscillospiraceae bacterium]
MADPFGLKIGLEGEKEFKKSIAEINQEFKVLGSEMKLVTAQFDKNDNSIEALTARQSVLTKEVDAQRQKVETLRAAMQNAAESFGENDRRTQAWQIQLNNAEAALIGMEKELDDNTAALNRAEKGMDDAGDSADDMADDVEDAADESEEAKGSFEGLGSVCKATAAAMTAAFAAVSAAAIAGAKALVEMSTAGAAYADTVLTESTVTGIATDKLQEYMYAAELVDVSTETLTKSMAKNIKSMQSAADGSAAYAEAYDKLGISVTDANGNLRDSEEVYWEIIDSLGKIENETERDAVAMQILGKSAQELNPLIEQGAARMAELGEQAHAAGYVVSDDMLNAYGALDDQLQYLNVGATAAKNALGTVLLPVLTDLATEGNALLGEFTNGILDANGDISKMSDVIGEMLPKVLDMFMEFLPELMEIAGEIVGSLATAIVDNLPTIIDTAAQIVFSLLQGLIAALPQIVEGALQLVLALVNGILANLPMLLNAALQAVVTLATGIANALPTLIPTIIEVVIQIVQTLIDNLPMILDAALQLIMGLTQGILDALPVLIAALPEIILGIITFLLDAIPQIIETGIQLITSLVAALPEIITAIVEAIPQIIEGIISAVLSAIPQIIQAGIDLLISLVKALPQIIVTIVNAIPDIISGIINAVLNNIPLIIQAGIDLLTSLITNLPTIIIEIVKAIPQIITGIVSALGKGVSQMADVGVNLVKGLWQGIQSLASWLWDKVSGWISSIWDGICDFFGIASPSKEMGWIGQMLVDGLAGSISDNGKEAVKAAEGMSADITDVMHGLAEDMETALPTDFTVDSNVHGTVGGGLADTAKQGGLQLVLNISTFNNYTTDDIHQLTNEIMVTAGQFAKRKGVVFA